MTRDEYFARPEVNWSLLKEMRRSPLQFNFRRHNPREDTKRLMAGRAGHTAILEPDRFLLDYALWTGDRRAGKEWDKFCAANGGKTILKAEDYAAALGQRDAVRAHPVAANLLRAGRPEETVFWTDSETGLACKARLDWLGEALVDVKTTVDVDARRFGALAYRYGYHCQLAFYLRGLRANGIDVPAKIIAVETAEPYEVAVFGLDEDVLWAGDEEVGELLRRVSQCEVAKAWPVRYPAEEPLALPSWAFPAEEDSTFGLTTQHEEEAA